MQHVHNSSHTILVDRCCWCNSCPSCCQNSWSCVCAISRLLDHEELPEATLLVIDLTSLWSSTGSTNSIFLKYTPSLGWWCWRAPLWTTLPKISKRVVRLVSWVHIHWLFSSKYMIDVIFILVKPYSEVSAFFLFFHLLFLKFIISHQWVSLAKHNIFAEFIRLAQTLTFMGSQWLPPEVSPIVTNT